MVPAEDRIISEFFPSASCTVQITRFVQDTQWYWREKWLRTPASQWRGPHPTREACIIAAGLPLNHDDKMNVARRVMARDRNILRQLGD